MSRHFGSGWTSPHEGETQVDIIMLTHRTIEKNVDAALARIEALPVVAGKVTRIRVCTRCLGAGKIQRAPRAPRVA